MSMRILVMCLAFVSLTAFADDYDKITARLTELDKLPNTTLFSLGKNDQGRDIMGIMVGDSRANTKNLVVGVHHGNERASAEVPLLFVQNLKPQADTLFYVIPVLNISGYNKSSRHETGPNGKSFDSNRDYEDACTVKPYFVLKSTALISRFIEDENIVSAVTVHGYVGTFTYPWGTDAKDYTSMDDAFMESLARASSKLNNYKIGTHGAAIYPAAGAFEDWAYFKHGVWSFLLEIKSPASDLNKDALALVEFFRVAPLERSKNVGQVVNCLDRILQNSDVSRP